MTLFLLSGAAVSLTALLIADAVKQPKLSAVLKVVTSALLVIYCFHIYFQQPSTYGVLIVIAITLGALGDVCLISKQKLWFVIGLSVFLLGHLVFIAAFLQYDFNPAESMAGMIGIGIAMYAVFNHIKSKLETTAMKAAVIIYMLTIAIMAAIALSIRVEGEHTLIGLGAILFLLSDYFVANNRFNKTRLYNRAIGLPLYYSAQFILATTIITLQTNSRWLPV
ncbi:lysoplasmalogenase [Pleionea mediterranea]|uniref:Putative membrane protein YhhN n=1 Tax=Pleionea mediterranea TaxID=523701 RepID=A0A316FZV3_9GAMM|nr:lysoplasmalogenase [Pleionea mediterranea]PWK53236.1 putative membrane protein YhhN [Pleionea mediterranea]